MAAIVKTVYGGRGVQVEAKARRQLGRFKRAGLHLLPICMAKTQSSLSDDPKALGRPTDFDVRVREVQLAAGAGFLVALTGEVNRMPGLGRQHVPTV